MTNPDPSMTRCETCGEEIIDGHANRWAHVDTPLDWPPHVPAPAPSTDLASDPLVKLLEDARMTIGMLRSFIDSGESLTLADRGGLIAVCDRLQNARDERRGFVVAPVPSSIEGDDVSEFKKYRRTQIAEMADWHEGFDMTRVSVSAPDAEAGSPKAGDKIARNPANHDDRWLVAAAYFAENFEPLR